MNRHREVIYADRRQLVKGEDMSERIEEMVDRRDRRNRRRGNSDEKVARDRLSRRFVEDYHALDSERRRSRSRSMLEVLDEDGSDRGPDDDADARLPGSRGRGSVQRSCARSSGTSCSPIIDKLWVEHLTEMDELREGVGSAGLRAERSPRRLQDRGVPDVPAAPAITSSTTSSTRSSACSRPWRSSRCGPA